MCFGIVRWLQSSLFSRQGLQWHSWLVRTIWLSGFSFGRLWHIWRWCFSKLVQSLLMTVIRRPPSALPIPSPSSDRIPCVQVSLKSAFSALAYDHAILLLPLVHEVGSEPGEADDQGEEDEIIVDQAGCIGFALVTVVSFVCVSRKAVGSGRRGRGHG